MLDGQQAKSNKVDQVVNSIFNFFSRLTYTLWIIFIRPKKINELIENGREFDYRTIHHFTLLLMGAVGITHSIGILMNMSSGMTMEFGNELVAEIFKADFVSLATKSLPGILVFVFFSFLVNATIGDKSHSIFAALIYAYSTIGIVIFFIFIFLTFIFPWGKVNGIEPKDIGPIYAYCFYFVYLVISLQLSRFFHFNINNRGQSVFELRSYAEKALVKMFKRWYVGIPSFTIWLFALFYFTTELPTRFDVSLNNRHNLFGYLSGDGPDNTYRPLKVQRIDDFKVINDSVEIELVFSLHNNTSNPIFLTEKKLKANLAFNSKVMNDFDRYNIPFCLFFSEHQTKVISNEKREGIVAIAPNRPFIARVNLKFVDLFENYISCLKDHEENAEISIKEFIEKKMSYVKYINLEVNNFNTIFSLIKESKSK